MADVDDSLLVRRAKRGDHTAVDALLRTHYDTVRAICHRIVINQSDAEDATQMALISIVRAIPSFDGRSKFSTWIYRIATNAALDEVRRIQRRPIPTDKESVYDSPASDRTSAVNAQMDVSAALAQLPEEYRTAIVLRHVADLDYEEIAAIQGVPVGTVRSRLARGRAQLAEILGNQNASSDRQTRTTTAPPEGSTP
ncbi:MAG: sigma-70 family RNA polymerase sigma factor [Ilumatobacteraceae bacterium]|nr:sigma-70 family RNA polymerase sigma factor [Ilumatobacteraceae bacterium]